MRKRELRKYENLLNRKIESLIGKAVNPVGGQVAEQLNYPDPTDQASMETDRNFTLRIRDRERKLILKARRALNRIENGSYGYCEICGDPISSSRLEARPEASLCIECKNEMEERERKARQYR